MISRHRRSSPRPAALLPWTALALLVALAGCTANARFDLSASQPDANPRPAPAPPPMPFLSDGPPPKASLGWSARRARGDAGFAHEVVVVRQGDTIHDIAARHGVTVPMIFSANGLLSDRITPGQQLVVPMRGARSATALPLRVD